jgi:hypothetical protein
MSYAFLENADGGTHIEIRVAKSKPKDRAFLEQVGAEFERTITNEIATLRLMLEQEKAASAILEEPKFLDLASPRDLKYRLWRASDGHMRGSNAPRNFAAVHQAARGPKRRFAATPRYFRCWMDCVAKVFLPHWTQIFRAVEATFK